MSGIQIVAVRPRTGIGIDLFVRRSACQLIAAIIVFVRGMAFGPAPMRFVFAGKIVQQHPKILIRHRLLVGLLPAVLLPTLNPFADSILDVLRVRDDFYRTRLFQTLKALDRGGKLHAIVRRARTAAKQFALMFAKTQNARPTALARIPLAGSVGD
jgi:hypothetical protein